MGMIWVLPGFKIQIIPKSYPYYILDISLVSPSIWTTFPSKNFVFSVRIIKDQEELLGMGNIHHVAHNVIPTIMSSLLITCNGQMFYSIKMGRKKILL
jgi:hypothetical protein